MNSAAKHGANVTQQLPADIRKMSLKRLQTELDPVNSYGIDDDQHLRFALHLQREGYSGMAAPRALKFMWAYRMATNPDLYARECACAEEWAAMNKRPASLPRVWQNLRDFQQANPPKPDLIRIIGRCGAMNSQLSTGGADAAYEQWRATLSILKFCEAGTDEIEALTGQHKDYDPDVTAHKMADISAPFRCETFSANECEGCKFRGAINSPIALGFQREPKAKKGAR